MVPATAAAIAVACSGGRDSIALLHATARAAMEAEAGIEVWALHVHHGLLPQADGWFEQLRQRCARWASRGLPVKFSGRRLTSAPEPGDSLEAWARRERYLALAEMATEVGAAAVLLAHHRQDQAETFVLQALRGGAPRGLSAMPAEARRAGLLWLRPWLGQPSAAIEAYVKRHRLSFAQDPSNADPRLARSRLRAQVWPALAAAFPDAEQTLSAAARRAQESAACLAELAERDAQGCQDEPDARCFSRQAWLALSAPRRANLLRHLLPAWCARAPADTLVQRLLQELPAARSGTRWPAPGGELQLYRGRLQWVSAPHQRDPKAASSPAQTRTERDAALPAGLLPGLHAIPGLEASRLLVEPCRGAPSLPVQCLLSAQWRPRMGGERFQRAAKTPARALKKQYQSAAVGKEGRTGWLLYSGEQLLYVPGLGMDARAIALPGDPRCRLSESPTRPLPTPGGLHG